MTETVRNFGPLFLRPFITIKDILFVNIINPPNKAVGSGSRVAAILGNDVCGLYSHGTVSAIPSSCDAKTPHGSRGLGRLEVKRSHLRITQSY